MAELSNFERFWEIYPHKKSKGAARKAFDKALKGTNEDEMTEEIISAVIAQKKYRIAAEASGEFIPQWKYPGVWLNAEAWSDEIKSHADLKEKLNLSTCTEDGCQRPVHGSKYDKCCNHTSDSQTDYNAEKRLYLRQNGIVMGKGETISDYAKKCRAHLAEINPVLAKKLKA